MRVPRLQRSRRPLLWQLWLSLLLAALQGAVASSASADAGFLHQEAHLNRRLERSSGNVDRYLAGRSLSSLQNETKDTEDTAEGILHDLDKLVEEVDDVTAWESNVMLPVVSMYMVALMIGNLLHVLKISWFPESLIFVLCGFVLGMAGQAYFGTDIVDNKITNFLDTLILNTILLPVIIFESGWSLNRRDFTSQLAYICLFAIAGTVISMVVVAACMVQLAGNHRHNPVNHWRTALAYASLISAVDPVATLACYTHLNVQTLLNVMVFGESVINDAVAISLFKVINDDYVWGDGQDRTAIFYRIVTGVLWNMAGSIALAVLLGMVYVLLVRFTRMRRSPGFVILFVFFSCFFTYSFAESVCQLSGIIAVLFNAMIISAFIRPHISLEGMLMTAFFLKRVSIMMDMAVFFFIGIAATSVDRHCVIWSLWLMLFCLLGRAAAVFPLGGVANLVKWLVSKRLPAERKHMLSFQHLIAMWHAGLRGGIALALTFELGDWVDHLDGEGTRKQLQKGTVIVICVFLLVFGGSTECTLRLLQIPAGKEAGGQQLYGPDDSHGIGWKLLEHIHKLFARVLVGKDAQSAVYMKEEGILVTLMKEARHQRCAAGHVEEHVGRKQSRLDTLRRDECLDLFGGLDPADEGGMSDLNKVLDLDSEGETGRSELLSKGSPGLLDSQDSLDGSESGSDTEPEAKGNHRD
eukprot:TRINITY_DN23356_c0_g1_i1.p1 TRINITY_DN23356_c0_g1~~TRINITY_DN23356_c0_g1_i1.p1  ORF type:complete len:695 (+),score=99.17 TRINITY_DN23356_c0_g1_i1:75-2159(+)